MKNTELTDTHISLGAKLMPFAGYNMPIQYEGINSEHLTVRNGVGVFDVSHMGEFFVRGQGALNFVQKITSNDVENLSDGQIQYSCIPNMEGGIIDDLLVYRINKEEFMMVVNASNISKNWNWMKQFKTDNVDLKNESDNISLLAVQGPDSENVLQDLTNIDLRNMSYYTFEKGTFSNIQDVLVSKTGYTGSGGFEIYCPNQFVKSIWDDIFSIGQKFNIKPIGLGARDTLRLEMGFCLYGNDIDDTTSPIEAGLSWITKCNTSFNSSLLFKKQQEIGVSKKLVGFELLGRGIPRKGYEILDLDENSIGEVTSGTMSPSLKKPIGLGYVKNEFSKAETNIYIKIRDKLLLARVIKLPFYKNTMNK